MSAMCERTYPRNASGARPSHAVLADEVGITQKVANYLRGHGYRVAPVHNGRSPMESMPGDPPYIVLFDLGLPGEDGFSIARQPREHRHYRLDIVTGQGDSVDKVVGREVYADDYVKKPLDLQELLARINAVLRRLSPKDRLGAMQSDMTAQGLSALKPALSTLCFAGWALDTAARCLRNFQGHDVALAGGEFDLLRVFAEHARRVLSCGSCSSRRAVGKLARSIGRSTFSWGTNAQAPRIMSARAQGTFSYRRL